MTIPTTSFAFRAKGEPAQVIPFPADAARRVRRPSSDDATQMGQILLFTGIRYERVLDTVEETAKPKRKRS